MSVMIQSTGVLHQILTRIASDVYRRLNLKIPQTKTNEFSFCCWSSSEAWSSDGAMVLTCSFYGTANLGFPRCGKLLPTLDVAVAIGALSNNFGTFAPI